MSARVGLFLVSLFLLPSQVLAAGADSEDIFAQADLLIEVGENEQALDLYMQAAKDGNAEAQYRLGEAYRNGLVTGTKYAEEGASRATHGSFTNPAGLRIAPAEAIHWIRKAARKGHPTAQMKMGKAYYFGYVVPKNRKTAAKWFRKAAEQGNAQAQQNLGAMYLDGIGVDQNDESAFNYFQKAAIQGNTDAKRNLSLMYFEGRGTAVDPEKGVVLLLELAENGDVEAQRQIGSQYALGKGVPQNWDQALAWLTKAAEQEDIQAMQVLEDHYRKGVGVEQNEVVADTWLERREAIVTDAILIKTVAPYYPQSALLRNTEGWVLLEFDISEQGEVENISVIDSSPNSIFNKVAKEAMAQFKYKPRTVKGQAVRTEGRQHRISFELED